MREYIESYFTHMKEILDRISRDDVENVISILKKIRDNKGRLFFVGVGGSAANASHAVNDFRKIVGIESYTPTDNVSELTARINDDGWDSCFSRWLAGSHVTACDGLFVLSVGGGDQEKKVSVNIINAISYAKSVGASVLGIVGRDGGYTAQNAHACIKVPVVCPQTITPHTEAFQAVLWHMLVSHPALQQHAMKWESLALDSYKASHLCTPL